MVGVYFPLEGSFTKFRTTFTFHYKADSVASFQFLSVCLTVILLAVFAYFVFVILLVRAVLYLVVHFDFHQLLLHVRLKDLFVHRLGIKPFLVNLAVMIPRSAHDDVVGIGMGNDIILITSPDIVTIQVIVDIVCVIALGGV